MKCPATGKVMHRTRANAKKACKAVKQKRGERKQAYHCDGEQGCGEWHIGEIPKWKREGREKAPGGRS